MVAVSRQELLDEKGFIHSGIAKLSEKFPQWKSIYPNGDNGVSNVCDFEQKVEHNDIVM